ncbi:MAG: nucleotide exchange factor GrpE [Magnetospiraceae bacterium]
MSPNDEKQPETPETAQTPEADSEALPEEELQEIGAEELGAIFDNGRLEELEAEKAQIKDQLLRAMAETENLRRRSAREKEDASRYAVTNFARDMLGVADNLHRALESMPKDADGGLAAIAEGVQLVSRELAQTFERHGIKKVEAAGKPFDHNLHQAMFEVPDASVPSGTVVQELAPGYVIHDRLLRPAMVGVAKGGPKEAPKPDADADGNGDSAAATAYDKPPEAGGKVDTKT